MGSGRRENFEYEIWKVVRKRKEDDVKLFRTLGKNSIKTFSSIIQFSLVILGIIDGNIFRIVVLRTGKNVREKLRGVVYLNKLRGSFTKRRIHSYYYCATQTRGIRIGTQYKEVSFVHTPRR